MKTLLFIVLAFTFLKSNAQVQKYDVVIDEIMADPSPAVQLPETEYIEIRNMSGHSINLQDWQLSSLTTVSKPFTAYNLEKDGFLILCAASDTLILAKYGKVLGVGKFPGLTNTGTLLTLISSTGLTIHAVEYSNKWYDNSVKSLGGWSLEMVDCYNACSSEGNWKESINNTGGTPGRINSVDASNKDETPPQLLSTFTIDSVTVLANFNETLDSTQASDIKNYQFTYGISVISANPKEPLFKNIQLTISPLLERGRIYQLTCSHLKDCSNNEIGAYNNAAAGLNDEAGKQDIVINEILFNPKPGGYDYVEMYNRTNKIIDGTNLYLANRDANNNLSTPKRITTSHVSLFPGDYIVVTENKWSLLQQYFVRNPNAIYEINSLPSFPDDKGTVVITNAAGNVIDEVTYSADWQFALINNQQGIALERIDPSASSQDKNNWHSASTTSGYGTPGYKNSQYKQTGITSGNIDIPVKTFSPDNDGVDDFLTINYRMEQPGYVANVFVFDAGGRMVKYLAKNNLLGVKGFFTWDGTNENNEKLPQGMYIIFSEIFNLSGQKNTFKNVVNLLRR